MDSNYLPMGQGLPRDAAGAKEWPDAWRPLEACDRELFLRLRDAPFLFRWGLGRYEHRRLVGVELIFRSGEREFVLDVSGRASLRLCIEHADRCIAACPALAADAMPGAYPARSIQPWLTMADVDVYVDGCGTFHVGDEIVALRNFGDADPSWRKRLVDEHRKYRKEFAFRLSEVNLLVDVVGEPIP